jgi:hypothetical protein
MDWNWIIILPALFAKNLLTLVAALVEVLTLKFVWKTMKDKLVI